MIYVVLALITLLTFLSSCESAITRPTRLALRVLAEKANDPRHRLLEEIARDRRRFLLPLQYSIQLILIAVAVLTANLFFRSAVSMPMLWAFVVMLVIVSVFRQLIPRMLTQGRPERALLGLLPSFAVVYRMLFWLSLPVTGILSRFSSAPARKEEGNGLEDETTDEEIQAYLGVGEEEGIFESTETRLIQSALEFGDTLVREIMTPRGEIVAIEENAALSELRDVIVATKHSRIPVYRETIDQIVGIVHVRNLLSHLEIRTVDKSLLAIVKETLIVPETKNVSQLLKEFQEKAQQMAIVVNEYGTVSGLVTVEDLLEEIVGEIHDEDEFRRIDVIEEGGGTYIVRGGFEVEDLEEMLGVSYGEHYASTVSGLIVNHLGKVPNPGETIVLSGTRMEILSSDRRRIHKLRVGRLSES